MSALFAHETAFYIKTTRHWWLDLGYAHPLFAPIPQEVPYIDWNSPCINTNIMTLRQKLNERIIRHLKRTRNKSNQ